MIGITRWMYGLKCARIWFKIPMCGHTSKTGSREVTTTPHHTYSRPSPDLVIHLATIPGPGYVGALYG
jgi:hypothetical protein